MVKTKLGKVCPIPKGEYNSETNYTRLDLVGYNGSGYIVKKDCIGIEPINEEYYMLLTKKGENAGATEEELKIIETLEKEIENSKVGYMGITYDTLEERINNDINRVFDKVDIVNYKDTTIYANNTYGRNLNVNKNKVEILGQTIQNCLDHSNIDKFSILNGTIDDEGYINIIADGTFKNIFTKKSSLMVKPNTIYTFIVDVKENTLIGDSGNYINFADTGDNSQPSVFRKIQGLGNLPIGITKFTITTIEDLNLAYYGDRCVIRESVISGSIKFRYAIVEGDWTDKEISFVPFGLNSSQDIKLLMYGKNIFKLKNNNINVHGINFTTDNDLFSAKGTATEKVSIEINDDSSHLANEISQGGTFIMSLKNATYNADICNISLTYKIPNDETIKYITPEQNRGAVTIPKGSIFDKVIFYVPINTTVDLRNVGIQFERANNSTEYEQFMNNYIQIDKPLRSINDNIRDRVYLSDGKVYHEQNISEIIFDGSDDENWIIPESIYQPLNSNYVRFFCEQIINCKFAGCIICDKLITLNSAIDNTIEENCMSTHSTVSNRIDICIEKNKLNTADINGIKQFLKANNLKVQYQLTTPIITELTDIGDFYSYEGQTNWYTTNNIKPTINVDIPSDLNAVVSTLMVENLTLKSENNALSTELESTNAIIEQQQANIDYILMMTEVEL